MKEIETYEDLAQAISEMTPEQRKQPIQCILPNNHVIQEAMSGIAVGTVADFEFGGCRSTHNNKYCGDDVIILLDVNSFGEDGAVLYEWGEPGDEGADKDGFISIYGKNGKTSQEEQLAPQHQSEDTLPVFVGLHLKNTLKQTAEQRGGL